MNTKRLLTIAVTLISCISAYALSLAEYPLLPVPQAIQFGKSTVYVKSASLSMPYWNEDWNNILAEKGVTLSPKSKYSINGELVNEIPGAPTSNDEAYSLTISKKGISVKATSEKGIYWALQTLRQLFATSHNNSLPECEIVDYPAFYWRGFMNDTGRSYISLEELKREINIMSQFKMNVFHWHFTENQAWRLESKIFPMLNDSVNMERQPGLYYTLQEAKELVEYAKKHNVMVLPEVDMPGHSAAFVRTFRHDMQSPEGMKILKLLLEEVCETFDVPYLHVGTDEVQFTNPDFVPEMVKFVKDKGKKIVSWNPGWNYKEGEIDFTTMWSYRGKPTPGIPAVDLRFHYINHFDTYADLVALYRSNVYGHKKAEDGIAGVEIGLWNDRYVEDEKSMIAQNSVYPTILAIAERSWHGGGEEYFDKLGTNLIKSEKKDYESFVDFENRLLWHKDNTLDSIDIPYVRQTNIEWLITDAFPNKGDLATIFPPETEGLKESYRYNDSIYRTGLANGAAVHLRHYWGTIVPGFYKNPKPNHTAYAFTWVYAPANMTVGLQAETQNYSRSESDIPPLDGKWDYRESKIWVNDKEIPAPIWTATHTDRTNEISLGNENFAAREPIIVNLKAGWNKVLIKLPVGQFSTRETRLVKWMFTFVFTTPDGKKAAPGLIYSPFKEK
ncbi:MAG: family 20 glycosylhydrolase [Bacteroidales bacterium]|nr:family 20 glycosylhydrolase [Bacteroidales bacterium]MBD5241043.1 family 20 glycosylhydrolase [Barnesiella sp.]